MEALQQGFFLEQAKREREIIPGKPPWCQGYEAPTDRLFLGTMRKTTGNNSPESLQIITLQRDYNSNYTQRLQNQHYHYRLLH